VGALAISFIPLQLPAPPWGSFPDALNLLTWLQFNTRIDPMRANIVGAACSTASINARQAAGPK